MKTGEAQVTVLVRDYDPAIAFYCRHLGFVLEIDTDVVTSRYVVLRHRLAPGLRVLLHRATSSEQSRAVGRQTGDFPLLVLPTDDAAGDHRSFVAAGLQLCGELEELPYGVQTTILDPLGNCVCMFQRF